MKELLNILELLRTITPKASGNVIFQFLIGNRKSPLTTSFPSVVNYVVTGWKSKISNLSPYFKIISNRLQVVQQSKSDKLNKHYAKANGNYGSPQLAVWQQQLNEIGKEEDLLIKTELANLYVTAWQDVKEKHFDKTFFDELKNMNYEDLNEDKFKKLKEEVLATKTMLLKLH